MITVKDFCDERLGFEEYGTDVPYFMIEFAKLHVEQALKEASKKAKCCDDSIVDLGHTITEAYVEENSILNAYPLENIK